MTTSGFLKWVHIGGTGWFVLSAGYVLAVALRQAGAHVWVIFSLTGYSAILFLLLTSVYLFAIFRGVTRCQISNEHPLTTSVPYIVFYDICPFLGSIAGFLSLPATNSVVHTADLCLIAEGTLATTFLVWIVIDPLAGVFEIFLPSCAEYRRARLAGLQQQQQQLQQANRKLLSDLELTEKTNQSVWMDVLEPVADELSQRLMQPAVDFELLHRRTVECGAMAWRMGGILCMRFLHQLVNQKVHRGCFDYLTIWWDGIGNWRRPSVLMLLKAAG